MSKDARIDIIYFNVPADWAFESELYAGPFQLRLLTQVSKTRIAAVQQLGKAVSRSETIIIVGGFYGNESLPSAIASAIGFELQRVGLPGADISETLLFPTGATPFCLDGRIRGATLKNGKQAIVFIDENRDGRVELAKKQIVPFIFHEQTITHKNYLSPEQKSQKTELECAIEKKELPAQTVSQQTNTVTDGNKGQTVVDVSGQPASVPEKITTEKVLLSDVKNPGTNIADIPVSDELSGNDANIIRQLPKLKLTKNSLPKLQVDSLPVKDCHTDLAQKEEKVTHGHLSVEPLDTVQEQEKLCGEPSVEEEKLTAIPRQIKMQPIAVYEYHKEDTLSAHTSQESLVVTLPENKAVITLNKSFKIAAFILLIILAAAALWFGYTNFAASDNVSADIVTNRFMELKNFTEFFGGKIQL